MSNNPLQPEKRRPVSLFVISGAIIVLLVLLTFARQQGWFEDTFNLRFRTDSADSLKKGMLVRLSGLPIGTVSKITLDSDGRITAHMKIHEDYHQWIRINSTATLGREGMFGDSYVQINPGTMTMSKIDSNTEVKFDPGSGLTELIQQAKEKIFPLLDELQHFAASLNASEGPLQSTLKEAHVMIAELRQTRAELDRTLAGTTKLTQHQLPTTLENVDKTLANFSHLAVQVDDKLAVVSQKLQSTLDQYEGTGAEAKKAVTDLQVMLNTLRPELQQVMRDADVLIRNSNQTMNNMQEHWPFTSDKPIPAADMPATDKPKP